MLTASQPVHYGYKSVHDLPTPPATSRLSPPPAYQETARRQFPSISRSHSPPEQQMSASHRGLPPPAAMTLPPQQSHSGVAPPPPTSAPPQSMGVGPSPHGQALGQLPGPPPQWQGAEDSMRTWLNAKTEEERRKQEEERTKQETLRLEQRRIEAEMLRASLHGGIPPPVVPLVFAGMGGAVSPTALDVAQQYLASQTQGQHPQLMAPQGPRSPDHRRGSQSYGQFSGIPSTPGSAPAPPGYVAYPQSPTGRPRAQTLSSTGSTGRPLPSLNTSVMQSGQPATLSSQGTNPLGQPQSASTQHQQPPQQQQQPQQQQETQQSPGIYFHHWQPPASLAGSSGQSGTPSAGESPRYKRKATGAHPQAPAPSHQRFRSPPAFQGSSSSVGLQGRRRAHSRQKSDVSSYKSSFRGRGGSLGPIGDTSPHQSGSSTSREGEPPPQHTPQQHSRGGTGGHSVSSLLSEEPAQSTTYPPTSSTGTRQYQSY